MKIIIKKSVVAMLALSLFLTISSVSASADGLEDLGKEVDGSILTNEESAEAIWQNVARGSILNQGIGKITNIGNRTVNIYGATLAYVTCDKLTVKMYLQRYDGGWINCGTYGDTATNASSMSRSYNVKVKGGYYYRVRVGCVAQKGSTYESQVPVTNGIWIQ
ncbi:hypothetical protein JCM17204_21110 [Blautia stercoris]|nr:DUF6147 family protein [Blautia stercoris]